MCSKYSNLRNKWIVKPENFEHLDQESKLGIALNLPENVKTTSQFIISAYSWQWFRGDKVSQQIYFQSGDSCTMATNLT